MKNNIFIKTASFLFVVTLTVGMLGISVDAKDGMHVSTMAKEVDAISEIINSMSRRSTSGSISQSNTDVAVSADAVYEIYNEKIKAVADKRGDSFIGKYYIMDINEDGISECILSLDEDYGEKPVAYVYSWDGSEVVTTKLPKDVSRIYMKNDYVMIKYYGFVKENSRKVKEEYVYYKLSGETYKLKKVGEQVKIWNLDRAWEQPKWTYKIGKKKAMYEAFEKWLKRNELNKYDLSSVEGKSFKTFEDIIIGIE